MIAAPMDVPTTQTSLRTQRAVGCKAQRSTSPQIAPHVRTVSSSAVKRSLRSAARRATWYPWTVPAQVYCEQIIRQHLNLQHCHTDVPLAYPARPITISVVSQVKGVNLTVLCEVKVQVKRTPAAAPAMYEDDLRTTSPSSLVGQPDTVICSDILHAHACITHW